MTTEPGQPPNHLADHPTWDSIVLVYRDGGTGGYIRALLFQKDKDTGETAVIGTITSADTAGELSGHQSILSAGSQTFDYTKYTYFIRVQLHRDDPVTMLEFHTVGLKDCCDF